ncbi:MAG: hypothetical protein FWB78_09405 [Treponema sp.]|nr:hypothetical protein [Treponema sp.]
MEDLTDSAEKNSNIDVAPGPVEPEPEPKRPFQLRNFPLIVKTAVRYAVSFSVIFFVLYMAGSMYVPGVPDTLLFMLLRLLRYSGFLLIVFSFIALGFGVHRLVYRPCARTVLSTLLYFFLILLGAVFIMFSLLIVEMSAGV